MAGGNRRKCKCCLKLFRPDPRNRHHQRYCSEAPCRAASKAASQARWRAAPENQGYFRGPVNVARVQAWRSRHPGYWRRARRVGTALQDLSMGVSRDWGYDDTGGTVGRVDSRLGERRCGGCCG